MANVVDYEEFDALRAEFRRERDENRFYRDVVCKLVWLNRQQAQDVIGVSSATMHRLIKAGRLPYRSEGNRHFFSIPDLITYLTSKEIGREGAKSYVQQLVGQQTFSQKTNAKPKAVAKFGD